MTPVWWVTWLSIALNLANAAWFLWLGIPVGAVYWLAAAVLTVCVTIGLGK
jgi:hypothetical protein